MDCRSHRSRLHIHYSATTFLTGSTPHAQWRVAMFPAVRVRPRSLHSFAPRVKLSGQQQMPRVGMSWCFGQSREQQLTKKKVHDRALFFALYELRTSTRM
jgi:hypothetical protein